MSNPLPRQALVVLCGCPDGATEATLKALGFSEGSLRLIVATRYAVANVEPMMCQSLVIRYRITAEGREALQ